MDFIPSAMDFIQRYAFALSAKGYEAEGLTLDLLTVELSRAEKFLLPTGADLGIKPCQATMNLIRVPYPCCAFEYRMNEDPILSSKPSVPGGPIEVAHSEKRIAIVWRVSPDEKISPLVSSLLSAYPDIAAKRGFLLGSIYSMKTAAGERWVFPPVFAFFELGAEVVPATTTLDGREGVAPSIGGEMICWLPAIYETLCDEIGEEGAANACMNDMATEIRTAIAALACLNARNVKCVSVEPPAKLNKKRARTGKIPYFQYKVLDIHLGGRQVTSEVRQQLDHLLSARSSSCLHSVRGHFKVRKSGIYWWSDFMRGRKENGEVKKEYNVIPEEGK